LMQQRLSFHRRFKSRLLTMTSEERHNVCKIAAGNFLQHNKRMASSCNFDELINEAFLKANSDNPKLCYVQARRAILNFVFPRRDEMVDKRDEMVDKREVTEPVYEKGLDKAIDLRSAVCELSLPDRQLIEDRFLLKKRLKDIAESYQISKQAVSVRLKKTLSRLRKLLNR